MSGEEYENDCEASKLLPVYHAPPPLDPDPTDSDPEFNVLLPEDSVPPSSVQSVDVFD